MRLNFHLIAHFTDSRNGMIRKCNPFISDFANLDNECKLGFFLDEKILWDAVYYFTNVYGRKRLLTWFIQNFVLPSQLLSFTAWNILSTKCEVDYYCHYYHYVKFIHLSVFLYACLFLSDCLFVWLFFSLGKSRNLCQDKNYREALPANLVRSVPRPAFTGTEIVA